MNKDIGHIIVGWGCKCGNYKIVKFNICVALLLGEFWMYHNSQGVLASKQVHEHEMVAGVVESLIAWLEMSGKDGHLECGIG